jgi:D-aminopeptidase
VLSINGARVGQVLGKYYLRDLELRRGEASRGGVEEEQAASADGSIIIVVATDAPLDHRQLTRLARRAFAGLARTGSSMSSGSGDYVIAFSTRRTVGPSDGRTERSPSDSPSVRPSDDSLSPLFQAVIEATEESIYNSVLRAVSVRGYRGTITALPLDSTAAVLRRHGAIRP